MTTQLNPTAVAASEPSTEPPAPTRRQLLIAAGLGAGSLTLAACGSTSTPAAQSPSTPAAATSGANAAPPRGNTLVALSKVPVGGAVAASDANGKPIIVAQPTAGKVVAFSAICTHQSCTVAVAGKELDCPCHGSKFNALTGAVLGGPAPSPLCPSTWRSAAGTSSPVEESLSRPECGPRGWGPHSGPSGST